MNWFLAKIVFRIICGDGDHIAQFDEQLRLIKASDPEHAYRKAVEIGEQAQESFLNERCNVVKWQFVSVCEMYKFSDFIDGAELYSRVQEVDNAELFIELMQKKSDNIRQRSTHNLLQLL